MWASAAQTMTDGVVAANRSGHVAAVSLGPAADAAGAHRALQTVANRLVVADLPERSPRAMPTCTCSPLARPPSELLIVLPSVAPDRRGYELLVDLAGGRSMAGAVRSPRKPPTSAGWSPPSTSPPRSSRHLALPVPAAMRGEPMRTDGSFDGAHLRALKARLRRRLLAPPASAGLAARWPGRSCAARVAAPARPHSIAARAPRAWAMRVGALALLWTPVADAAPRRPRAEPPRRSRAARAHLLRCWRCSPTACSPGHARRWPPRSSRSSRSALDALRRTQLLIRSLLGPNPDPRRALLRHRQRAQVGASPCSSSRRSPPRSIRAARGRRAAQPAMALAGIALAVVEGSARIGAGVGGVILVSAGTAVATVHAASRSAHAPARADRARSPASWVSWRSPRSTCSPRTAAATSPAASCTPAPLATCATSSYAAIRPPTTSSSTARCRSPPRSRCSLAGVGVRRRERLLAPVDCDPAWLAALAGGLAAGVVGALSEDSGPVLLVVAVFVLCLPARLPVERPAAGRDEPHRQRTPGRRRAARSRARTPPGALAR